MSDQQENSQQKNIDSMVMEHQVSGKNLRKLVPRSSHGDWTPAADRGDPLVLLQNQDKGRLQDLLPIKYGRMLASPFSFLRGSAVVIGCKIIFPAIKFS